MLKSSREIILSRLPAPSTEPEGDDAASKRHGGAGLDTLSSSGLQPSAAHPTSTDNRLVERFLEQIELVDGRGATVGSREEAASYIAPLVKDEGITKALVARTPLLIEDLGIPQLFSSLGVEVVADLDSFDPHRAAQCDIGVTEAAYGIAETGTVVALSAIDEPRSCSLIPPCHLCFLRSTNIAGSLEEFLTTLYKSGYTGGYDSILTSCVTLITGPSRTADIELRLTLGVHGPRSVHVLVWEEGTARP